MTGPFTTITVEHYKRLQAVAVAAMFQHERECEIPVSTCAICKALVALKETHDPLR